MQIKVKKTLHSLTGKLILSIGALMVVGSAIFWYFLINYQEKELIRNSTKYGHSFIDFMKKSTRYGMLTFQQPLIQQTVETIGSAEGVISVRIFNPEGKIAYSSKKEEVGTVTKRIIPYTETGDQKNGLKWSIDKDKEGYRRLNIVGTIYNEPACYTAYCHIHSKGQKALGHIESVISLSLLDKAITQQEIAITAYVIGFICLLSVVLCKILWNTVSVPISILAKGMEEVAAGNLNHTVKIDTKDELGALATSFNAMTSDIRKAKNELVEWGSTLEKKVQEKTEAIRKAQAQLVHSEKLASLGRMAAGVAHEINSPLTGIVTFSHLLQKKFAAGTQEREDIDVIIDQANRCSNIIKGLLGFARASAADKTAVNINDILNSLLNIVRNKADFFNVKIVPNYEEKLHYVKADTSQLQQVFLNMIMNAADAMDGKGTITINTKNTTENGMNFIEIEFRDTGSGITDKNLEKIFEPFFTTKPVGKGTGLGLAVSHGIIQEHGGNIFVKTKPGNGTSFFIKLPANKEVL